MSVLFICRGNAFRSIMAETYLRSLGLPGVNVQSAGTIASQGKEANRAKYAATIAVLKRHHIDHFAKNQYAEDVTQAAIDEADVVVCLNQRVYDEAARSLNLPKTTRVWDVPDVEEANYQNAEETYQHIVQNVDQLAAELVGPPASVPHDGQQHA